MSVAQFSRTNGIIAERSRPSIAGRLLHTLATWQQRSAERQQLAQLSDRSLRDLGLSRADTAREATKPFWQA